MPEVQTADSCFGLIGPRQCGSIALGGSATSTVDRIMTQKRALNRASLRLIRLALI